jgi:hypothetical protein
MWSVFTCGECLIVLLSVFSNASQGGFPAIGGALCAQGPHAQTATLEQEQGAGVGGVLWSESLLP